MPENLLSYQGNAGLGLGGNGDIQAPSNTNFKVINDTLRDIMSLDQDRNMKMFQQKVKDRDTLSNLILDNQVNPGNLEPKYMEKYKEGLDEANKAFDDWRGNLNDHAGYRKYQDAITNLRSVAAHGGANTVELQKLRQQQANEQLPSKKADIGRHIQEQQDQDFWEPVKPYQQLHDLNPATFSGFVEPIKTEERDPNNPAKAYDVSKIDYDSILRNSRNAYVNDLDKANDIQQLYQKFSSYDQPQLKKTVQAMNSQIDKYNLDNGFVDGQKGFVQPIQTGVVDKDGNIAIKEFPADFAAKYALANNEEFISKTPKFDYKLLKAQTDEEKNKIMARKVGFEGVKANAYAAKLNAQTKKYLSDNQDQATNVQKQYQDFVDNVKPGGIIITDKKGKESPESGSAIFVDDLPESYRYINGPIAGAKTVTDKNGKVTSTPTGKIEVGKLEPFITSNGKSYYIPKYVDPQTGEKLSLKDNKMKQNFLESKQAGFKGTFDEYLRVLLKGTATRPAAIEMVLQGKNGTANYTSMYQSAKLIHAQTQKKGGENVANPPAEGPLETDDSTQPEEE